MTSMRAAVLRDVHDVAVEERPIPTPGPDEVLVRVGSVGICGSDVHYYESGRIGPYVVDKPLVLGHEAGGEVVDVGERVLDLAAGQRVALEPGVPCRSCTQCRTGRYNLCPHVRFFGTPPFDGALSEYVCLPADFAYPIPDTLSDDAAGLLEPLSVAVWACRLGEVTVGSRVLVTGAGPVGLIAAQTAAAFGAEAVLVTDVNPQRLAVAAELGADTLDVSSTPVEDSGFAPDVLLECSGNARATSAAVRTVAARGRVILVGMGADEVSLSLPYLQDHELTVRGVFRYANTWPAAIALAASGAVQLDRLVTGRYGLDAVEEALTAQTRDPASLKTVVRPGE
jgi:L-iditol 2-dehydrogenase